MNVLNVGLVLLDEAVEGEGVEPDCIVDVSTVLVGVLAVEVLVVQSGLQFLAPLTHCLTCVRNIRLVLSSK